MTQSAYNQLVNAPFDQAANANVKNTRIPWERLKCAIASNRVQHGEYDNDGILNADFSGAGTGAGTDIDTGLGSVTEKMKKTAKARQKWLINRINPSIIQEPGSKAERNIIPNRKHEDNYRWNCKKPVKRHKYRSKVD